MSDYFSIEDYVNASTSKLYISLSGFILGSALGYVYGYLKDVKNNIEKKSTKKQNFAFSIFLLVSLLLSILTTIWMKHPGRFLFYGVSVFVVVYWLLEKLVEPVLIKYLIQTNRPIEMIKSIYRIYLDLSTAFLILLMLISVYALMSASYTGEQLKESNVKVVFTNDTPLPNEGLVLLGTSSKYFFFYHIATGLTYSVPASKVLYVAHTKSF